MSHPLTSMNLSGVDLNLLWTLHVVLDTPTVAAASRRLGVTPSAVSNALARLRDLLDDPLLVRHGRGLVPTPRAEALRPVLASVFADLDHALLRDGGFDAATTPRTFRLALSDGEQVTVLPALAAAFARRFPKAALEIVSVDTLIARGGLAGSDVDAALGPDGGDAHQTWLFDEGAVLVVRTGHPALDGGPAALFAQRHVDVRLALGQGGQGHAQAETAMRGAGIVRDVAVVVPTFSAAARVVAATDWVAGLPNRLAEAAAATLPLQIVPFPGPFAIGMYLLWHARTDADPGSTAFRALVREVVQDGLDQPS